MGVEELSEAFSLMISDQNAAKGDDQLDVGMERVELENSLRGLLALEALDMVEDRRLLTAKPRL